MARGRKRKQEWRILGPRQEQRGRRTRWRIVIVNPQGDRKPVYFSSEAKASKGIAAAWRKIGGKQTIAKTIEQYLEHLWQRVRKGYLAEQSVTNANERLSRSLRPTDRPMIAITRRLMKDWYKGRCEMSVDTVKGELGELRRFFDWCMENGFMSENLAIDLVPKEDRKQWRRRRKKGKAEQKPSDENMTRWLERAWTLARQGNEGAVAVLVLWFMRLRNQDITRRKVRDVEGGGTFLSIPEAKTDTSSGEFPIPAEVQPLIRRLVAGRDPDEPLFKARNGGHHWRDWPTKAIKSICDDLGIPRFGQQVLKGKAGDWIARQGVSIEEVSKALHHADTRVTKAHYVNERAGELARIEQLSAELARVRQELETKKMGPEKVDFPVPRDRSLLN